MCNRMRILKNIIWSTAKIPTDMVCVLQASESHWLNVCLIDIRPKVCEICSIYMGYYCSFHNVEENSQLLRYLKWMSALGLAVRFQAEWRSEKAFSLFQIMLFSRVFQSVRDECWVVRMAPSNTFLAQLSLVGLSWVTHGCSQADFVLLPFSASSEEKRSSSVPAWREQMELEWLTERLSAGVWCWGQPMEKWRCCWAGIEGSSGTEPDLGLYF